MDRLEMVGVGEVDLEVEVLGSGEPVLVIQTALTADELRPLSQRLAHSGEYQVLHYHRRGYAGSGPARRQGSLASEAADAGALIRAMDVAPVHLVGVSYSAAIGLAVASSSPELVQTVAVVEPPPAGTPDATQFQNANRQLLRTYEALGPKPALEQFMTMLVGENWREVSERHIPGSVDQMERDADTFFGSDVPALLSWRFDAAEAGRIHSPALYVGGSQSDSWFTQMRARILRLLPHATDGTIDGAGHLVASTHPADVAALLLEHFRRHPRPLVM